MKRPIDIENAIFDRAANGVDGHENYCLMRLAAALEDVATNIDRLGLNHSSPAGTPGVFEFIGMELPDKIGPTLTRIAAAMEEAENRPTG